MRRLWLPLLLLVVTLPARAGLFDDDVARERIVKLQEQMDALTQRIELATRNQMDFTNQMEAIRADLAKLRGQMEEVVYNLDAAQKRQKDFYVDLDNRLRKLEQGGATPAEAAKPAVDPAAESKDYESALTALKAAHYKEAIAGFGEFIKTYPSSGMLPSAYFWSGYALTQAKDYARAAAMYGKLASTWPNDNRAADALAEQASALALSGDKAGAKKALELLAEKYPDSEAAKQNKLPKKKK
ncbi:MAG TPA: tol-pal system protein YbgF [Rhodocyclaceae bacterium]